MQNEKVTRLPSNNDCSTTAHSVYSPHRPYHTQINPPTSISYDHPELQPGQYTGLDAPLPESLRIEGDSLDEAESASSSTNSWPHVDDIEQDTDSLMDLDTSTSHPHPTPPSPSAAKRPRLEVSDSQAPLYQSPSNARRIRVASPMTSSAPSHPIYSDTKSPRTSSHEPKPHTPNILPASPQTHRPNVNPENIPALPFPYPFPAPQSAVAGTAPASPRKGKGTGKKRGNYRCRKCGQAKKGHTCEGQSSPPSIVPSSPGPSNTPSPDQALQALREKISQLTAENKTLKEEREQLRKQIGELQAQKTVTTHLQSNSNVDGHDINSYFLNSLTSGLSSSTSSSVSGLPPSSLVSASGYVLQNSEKS